MLYPEMGYLIAIFVITVVSLVIVRVGATALMLTGLGWDAANFQSYSAFFGVGFTTREAEMVVNHPVRRRIIRDLIVAGNIGFTSVLATVIVTFLQKRSAADVLQAIGWIAAGLLFLFLIWRFGVVQRVLDQFIHWSLRRAGMIRAMDYELLLRIGRGYCISEVEVMEGSAIAGKSLRELRLADRGVIILGILRRSGEFQGAPSAEDRIELGDLLTVYGHESVIHGKGDILG